MTVIRGLLELRVAVLWLRAYRLVSLIEIAILTGLLLTFIGTASIPIISVRSAVSQHISIAALLPLGLSIALSIRSDPGIREIEIAWPTSHRRSRLAFELIGTTMLLLPAAALIFVSSTDGIAIQVLRNTLCLVGLSLMAAVIFGSKFGWSVPTIYVFVALTMGVNANGSISPWALLLDSRVSVIGWAVDLVILVVGMCLFSWLGPRSHLGDEDI